MSDGKELAKRDYQELITPETAADIAELDRGFAIAVHQRELLAVYIKARLNPGKHFYHVPGSEKDSLNKEGAELICLPHGYKPDYEWISGPEVGPEDNAPYQITLKCRLLKNEHFAGAGIGSASSWITKKDGTRQPRQRDPGLCHNATIKMAQKSAYIAATLSSTAASEFFTQDLDEEAASAPAEADNKGAHWCPEHKTNWFRKGKMKNYAHPVGDSGQWCNEPSSKPTPTTVEGTATAAPTAMSLKEFSDRFNSLNLTPEQGQEAIGGMKLSEYLRTHTTDATLEVLESYARTHGKPAPQAPIETLVTEPGEPDEQAI